MGTNYYACDKETKEELYHIGKRSAAGYFCWDCGVSYTNIAETYTSRLYSMTAYHRPTEYNETSYLYGNDAVHMTRHDNKLINGEPEILDCCPICGKPKEEELTEVNSAYAELGFSKQPGKKHNTTCSFSFAVSPYVLSETMKNENIIIKNEYGEELSKEQFKEVLQDCGLKYFHSVGQEFC